MTMGMWSVSLMRRIWSRRSVSSLRVLREVME